MFKRVMLILIAIKPPYQKKLRHLTDFNYFHYYFKLTAISEL